MANIDSHRSPFSATMASSQPTCLAFILLLSSVLCSAHKVKPGTKLYGTGVGATWQWGSSSTGGEPHAGSEQGGGGSSSGYVSGGADIPVIPLPVHGNAGGGGSDPYGAEPLYCTPLSCHLGGHMPCAGFGLYFDGGKYRPIRENWAKEEIAMGHGGEAGAPQGHRQGHHSGAMAPGSASTN